MSHHEQPLNPGKLAGLSNPGPELLTKIKLTVLQFHYPTHTFICFSLWTIFCPLSGLSRPSCPFLALYPVTLVNCKVLFGSLPSKNRLPRGRPSVTGTIKSFFLHSSLPSLALCLHFSYSFENTFLSLHASLHLLLALAEWHEWLGRPARSPSAHKTQQHLGKLQVLIKLCPTETVLPVDVVHRLFERKLGKKNPV